MVNCVEIYGETSMKTQQNFSEKFSKEIFQRNFLEFSKKIFQDRNQKDFPQSFVEGVVKNFTAGVGSLAKKAKEVEDDARRRFCHYPSA
jgi:hypothetical protein